MLKRFLIVCLMICLFPFGTVYAEATETDTEAIRVVTALGLMENAEDGTFRPEGYVNTEEVCKAFFRMRGLDDTDALRRVREMGIFHETVRGEETAETKDALSLMVCALGGERLLKSGWEAEKIAAEWGIEKGNGRVETKLTRECFASLLFSTLSAKRRTITQIEEGRAEFSEGSELLYDVFYTREVRGLVRAGSRSTLDTEERLLKDEIQIENTFAKYTENKDWTGHAVRAYLRFSSPREEDAEVLFIADLKESEEIRMLSDRISEKSNTEQMVYYPERDSKRTKTLSVSENAFFLYNGFPVLRDAAETEGLHLPKDGEVCLIDSDGDGKGDCVKIWDYQVFVLEFANLQNNALFARNGRASLSLADRPYRIFSEEGAEEEISSLQSYDVLLVALPKGTAAPIQMIRAKRRTYQGVLMRVDTEEALIGKDAFRTAEGLEAVPNGTDVTAYADPYGRIVFWESGNDFDYGFVTHVAYDPDEEERIVLRMYTFDHGSKLFYTAKTVGVYDYAQSKSKTRYFRDKSGAQSFEVLFGLMQGRNELIRFRSNADGEVREIAYCGSKVWQDMPDEKEEFHIYYGTGQRGWSVNFNQEMFDSKVRVTERTKLLSLEGDPENPSRFRRLSLSDLAADNSFDVRIYDVNEKFEAGVIIFDDIHEYYSQFGNLVTRVETVLGEDEEEVLEFTVYNLGTEQKLRANRLDLVTDAEIAERFYNAGTKLSEIGVGDVIYYKLGADGMISGFAVLYKNKEQNFYHTSAYGWNGGVPSAAMTVAYFPILKTYEDLLVADLNGARPIAEYTWRNYYIYDSARKRIEKASFRDVRPGDRVVGFWKWANLNDLIIYR